MMSNFDNSGRVDEPRLSICMATYNRGKFIGETLDSIVVQMNSNVEIVIVDGASPDNTQEVLAQYLLKHPGIRYFREPVNSGVDADFDKAIGYARGEYCWLMSDDDLLKPDALSRVLSALDRSVDLIVVNSEVRDSGLNIVLEPRRLDFCKDRIYQANESGEFFTECLRYMSFIGCVVIRRSLWLERERAPYYGSLFVHVGVICQKPLSNTIRVVAEPLIILRYGNAMWTPRGAEIWMFIWPNLVWSFDWLSTEVRNSVCPMGGLRKIKTLFHQRALGGYNLSDFHQLFGVRMRGGLRFAAFAVSFFPEKLANIVSVLFLVCLGRANRLAMYDLLRSRNSSWLSHRLAQLFQN